MPEQPRLAPFNAKELRLFSDLRLGAQAPHTISMAEPSQEIEKLCLFITMVQPKASASNH